MISVRIAFIWTEDLSCCISLQDAFRELMFCQLHMSCPSTLLCPLLATVIDLHVNSSRNLKIIFIAFHLRKPLVAAITDFTAKQRYKMTGITWCMYSELVVTFMSSPPPFFHHLCVLFPLASFDAWHPDKLPCQECLKLNRQRHISFWHWNKRSTAWFWCCLITDWGVAANYHPGFWFQDLMLLWWHEGTGQQLPGSLSVGTERKSRLIEDMATSAKAFQLESNLWP